MSTIYFRNSTLSQNRITKQAQCTKILIPIKHDRFMAQLNFAYNFIHKNYLRRIKYIFLRFLKWYFN